METLQTAVITGGSSHNLTNLLLRNVTYDELNLTIRLHRKQIFEVFLF